ncbi:hypothetical protein ACFQGW_09535 [Xanthomonas theicola]|uniref:hypothetical protein n=1 Tax=Xanthomonas theicola TaxID=56464 RepID=UPI001FE93CD0|nr:hypothetical protein [Xanthomonas theicola]
MKIAKWIVILLSFGVALGLAYTTIGANQHLIDSGVGVSWYVRYVIFLPGATLCAYLLASLVAASRWSHFVVAVFLLLPALIMLHFVVSVMNAHTGNVYWGWQILEIALTYFAWTRTGKCWSKSA